MKETFKDTNAFKLITILEQVLAQNKIRYKISFIFNFMKYEFINKIKLRKNLSINQILSLSEELFKDYFYTYITIESKNFKKGNSIMTYYISNNKIDSIISFKNTKVRLYISYDLTTKYFTMYMSDNKKNLNINERNLKIKENRKLSYSILKLLYNDILYIMMEMFSHVND